MLAERLNRTVAGMISVYVEANPNDWRYTAVQENTGFTPFHSLHGREAVTTLDRMLLPSHCCNVAADAAEFARRAVEAHHLARMGIHYQQQNDARRYNLRRRDATCQPGDKQWAWTRIRQRGHSEQLLRGYFGPYTIV